MATKNILSFLLFLWCMCHAGAGLACSVMQQKPLSLEQAKEMASAVFVGEVTSVEDKWPADFKNSDPNWPETEKALLQRYKKKGYTVHMHVDSAWKGIDKPEIAVAMRYPLSTCDGATSSSGTIESDWHKMDGKQLIFADKMGNYLTLASDARNPLASWRNLPINADAESKKYTETLIKQLGKPTVTFKGTL